jgi:hypothetical protein
MIAYTLQNLYHVLLLSGKLGNGVSEKIGVAAQGAKSTAGVQRNGNFRRNNHLAIAVFIQ